MSSRQVWITEPGRVEVKPVESSPPGPEEVRLRVSASGISPGTELLAYRGELPPVGADDTAIDTYTATGGYPIQTGYCLVGRIEAVGEYVEPTWISQRVFAFHPHASRVTLPVEQVLPIPDAISDDLATFIPNLETAMGLVMDARPVMGERIVVLGQGVVGLLVTQLLASLSLELLAVVDPVPRRRELGRSFGAHRSFDPYDPEDRASLDLQLADPESPGADVILELSGNPAALDDAISLAGFAGRVVAGSWYGSKTARIDLGGRFHRNRISLISSQVSTISPELGGRWTKQRRMKHVMRTLTGLELDHLISHRISLDQAGSAFELLDQHPEQALQVILTSDEYAQNGSH